MTTETFSTDQLRDFVIAAHWDLPTVKTRLAQFPEMLNAAYPWSEHDHETAVQAAAHAGSRDIAEYLLSNGAPLEICTAAMLGRTDEVAQLLDEDPDLINAHGAHQIPLMAHAAWSGDISLARMLFERGAREGMSFALSNAVTKGHVDMARWLLENGEPDLSWMNYEGKTVSMIALEGGNRALIDLLREHGAA